MEEGLTFYFNVFGYFHCFIFIVNTSPAYVIASHYSNFWSRKSRTLEHTLQVLQYNDRFSAINFNNYVGQLFFISFFPRLKIRLQYYWDNNTDNNNAIDIISDYGLLPCFHCCILQYKKHKQTHAAHDIANEDRMALIQTSLMTISSYMSRPCTLTVPRCVPLRWPLRAIVATMVVDVATAIVCAVAVVLADVSRVASIIYYYDKTMTLQVGCERLRPKTG